MALFCAAIRKDSVSLLQFSFLSHAQVFLCEISPVCRKKYPFSCFSPHFCFLVIVVQLVFMLSVLFLVTVISLPLFFLSNSRVLSFSLSSTIACHLPPFHDMYSLLMSSLAWMVPLLKFFLCLFQKWSQEYFKWDSPCFYPFDKIPAI